MHRPYPPSAQIRIDAPLQAVWDMLLDGTGYHRWNSFIPQIHGDLKTLRTPIKMRVQLGGKMTGAIMQSVELSPPHRGKAVWVHEHASWLAKAWLVRSRRSHWLMALSDTQTLYETREPFSGLLRTFVPYGKIDAGFKTQAADLKRACEGEL